MVWLCLTACVAKRVIILLDWLELGGAEQQAMILAEQIRDHHGVHIQVWGLHPPGRVAELCEEQSIPWHYSRLLAPSPSAKCSAYTEASCVLLA